MEIPKYGLTDLHVHLDGSLSFDMARELAKMQGMEMKSEEELKSLMVAPEDCQDLNDYLTK
ncbi:MAG: adenosine deaminase, partial [Frisingicoccus sp.]